MNAMNHTHTLLSEATEDKSVYSDRVLNERLRLLLSFVQLFVDNGNEPTDGQIEDYLKSILLID